MYRMRRTRAKDCRELGYPAERVYAALLDWRRYERWWPAGIGFELLEETPEGVGSRAAIRPIGAEFVCEIRSVIPNRQIVIAYSGIHAGEGIWTLEPSGGGTHLCYQVDLEPQGFFPQMMSEFIDFAHLHSSMMRRVFDGLERYLGQQPSEGHDAGR